MNGEGSLLEAAATLRRQGGRAVLATLVAVEGSAVRRAGARLLILPGGRLAGFLSAGCVEQDLAARVGHVLAGDRAETVRYDPGGLTDPVLGLGLGCGGGMTVLLEPWPPREGPDPLAITERVARLRRPAAIATVIAPAEIAGVRTAVTADGHIDTSAPSGLSQLLEELTRQGLRGSNGMRRAGSADVFVQRLEPPLRLLIQGATPPALALARLGTVLGWETVLVAANGGTFAELLPAGEEISTARSGSRPPGIEPDQWTVAALLAHDTAAEARLIPALLTASIPYVGVMGSRTRRERLVAELRHDGVPAETLKRLHMPIGLDIGGESAAEIALAAAAEIVAVLHKRNGGRLSRTAGPNHDS